jgi:cobaltochelatase CobN
VDGVIFVEQTPAPIALLTAKDTDILTLTRAVAGLPVDAPAVRVANLLQLQQQLAIDAYADTVLAGTQVIILRLLGGRSYWSYGLEVVEALARRTGAALVVLPGDDRPDPDLVACSTVPLAIAHQLWRYFTEGGTDNARHALLFAADAFLGTDYQPPSPIAIPRVGCLDLADLGWVAVRSDRAGRVGILFYRAYYQAGNLGAIAALAQALADRGLEPVPVYVSSLQDPEVQAEAIALLSGVDGLVVTTGFAIAKPGQDPAAATFWTRLDVPVIQAMFSSGTVAQWAAGSHGLSPRDLAMQVALPEVDGRIMGRAVAFKTVLHRDSRLETEAIATEPLGDRVAFVADLVANWVGLRRTPVGDRRVALVLANYPNRDGRLANGVGLDTPQSTVELLCALAAAGYDLGDRPLPTTGDELITQLTTGITNDPEGWGARSVNQTLSRAAFDEFWRSLPEPVRQGIGDRWGQDLGGGADGAIAGIQLGQPPEAGANFAIAGIQFGNIFVGIQPSRGYDRDPSLNYHAPDLEPTPDYLAFYAWVRRSFGAQAIAHVGKHGNLEWLPGKGIALAQTCYPEAALGPLPHLYPFIVNDPGEGSQAKRRSQAVILDHLTPPLTRAELYGNLQRLEGLVDEYYEAQSLDPRRTGAIARQIATLVQTESLTFDLTDTTGTFIKGSAPPSATPQESHSGPPMDPSDPAVISVIDGYLCELKEAQIRDGLHILGRCPQGTQLRDLAIAIARSPAGGRLGLTQAIAQAWRWELDPLTADPAQPLPHPLPSPPIKTVGNADLAPIKTPIETPIETPIQAPIQAPIETPIETPIQAPIPKAPIPKAPIPKAPIPKAPIKTVREAIAHLEAAAAQLLHPLIDPEGGTGIKPESAGALTSDCTFPSDTTYVIAPTPDLERVLSWIQETLLPAVRGCDREITNLVRALDGRYVPPGPSGAPTRGRPEVLPTGRNFYSVDLRALPTESAWDVGRRAAERVIEQYVQEQGEYPQTLGLSVWGTATMRTGGDDIAEALALLGVRPVWDGAARRVVDFEILPLSALGRPRVDVTLRISGFFRDAFPHLIDLCDRAIVAIAALDEPPDQNPLADRVRRETAQAQSQGLTPAQARDRALYRIFGSKPGAYGAGLQGLIEAQNWDTDADLARAYINWSSYAYTSRPVARAGAIAADSASEIATGGDAPSNLGRSPVGHAAPESFATRLSDLQIVLHNQDNREHDLLDSDDYYQFQGGLTAAVRTLSGQQPTVYFGDHSRPARPQVRPLSAELVRVYRSRVANPKWIAGAMRHGYKGAFELAATVDYLFAYDATTRCVEDFVYTGVAQAYLGDEQVRNFLRQTNPWALRDMAERLLEAHQRSLWTPSDRTLIDQLTDIALDAEAVIEGAEPRSSPAIPPQNP